jgi:tripartite-type tricarboxylate transporter receptor subunit TctC
MTRIKLLVAAGVVAIAALAAPARATDWPTRPVTVVVPMAAGGNTDLMARLAADQLGARLGQPFVVENRPSAGGALASGQVANATPDGHTILFSPAAALVLTPLLQKLNFDPAKQLVPVTNVGTGAQVVAIKRELPVKTLPEFIAYARANPGKLNFAIAGTQNISHLGPVLLFKRAGVDVTMVPSRGEPQAISDLTAGLVDLYFGNAAVLLQQAGNEHIRLIAVGTAQRLAAAPDLPTVAETFPGFVFSSWNGFSVPAGTPDAIVDKLRSEVTAIVTSPEISQRLKNLGIVPGGQTKDEVTAVFKADRETFAEAVKAAGINAP